MAAFETATVGLVVWWSANNALTANPGGALSVGRAGVGETAGRIESDARARGAAVIKRTDHAGLARRNGYRIRPVETLLIDDGAGERTRVVVWQAPDGMTVVSADERTGAGAVGPGALRAGSQAQASMVLAARPN